MRKWVPAIAIAAMAGALFVYWFFSNTRQGAPQPGIAPSVAASNSSAVVPEAKSPAASKERPATNAQIGARLEGAPAARSPASARGLAAREAGPAPLEFTNFPPEIVVDHMRIVFHQYASMFGGNPVGTNPEITAALHGDNPKGANFIDPEEGMRINANGELVDPWGTPYFFHQLSGTDMEIHSAGPDRIMWTADDIVIK